MGGVKGKSGPPGNSNAAGNPGGGAPIGNQNSRRHGLFSVRGPASTRTIDRAVNVFRRHLEEETLRLHGEITVLAASLIQTATEAKKAAMATQRELRENDAALEPEVKARLRKAVLDAFSLSDKKLADLGITLSSKVHSDPWVAVDAQHDSDRLASLETRPEPNPPSEMAEAVATREAKPEKLEGRTDG